MFKIQDYDCRNAKTVELREYRRDRTSYLNSPRSSTVTVYDRGLGVCLNRHESVYVV